MKHLFLLEDDTSLNETICEYLESQDFRVTTAMTGSQAQELLFENRYDLLILDVNVPAPDGFTLLHTLRLEGITTPAVFLTSRDALEDVESGFEQGCDDYIRKPFALKELRLRIEALLKREFFHEPTALVTLHAGITYDTRSDTLFKDALPLALHDKEKKLLQLFLKHANTLLSHETIMEHLWSYDETPSEGSLRTYIKNLRKIVGKEHIVSIKRYGYRFST